MIWLAMGTGHKTSNEVGLTAYIGRIPQAKKNWPRCGCTVRFKPGWRRTMGWMNVLHLWAARPPQTTASLPEKRCSTPVNDTSTEVRGAACTKTGSYTGHNPCRRRQVRGGRGGDWPQISKVDVRLGLNSSVFTPHPDPLFWRTKLSGMPCAGLWTIASQPLTGGRCTGVKCVEVYWSA